MQKANSSRWSIPGQTLVIPAAAGATTIAVGVGDPSELTAATLRTAAAAAVRAAGSRASLATTLADLPGVDAETAACAVAEGALLGAYRHGDLGLTYPIMRGFAPLLVALGSGTLLGESPSMAAWLGLSGVDVVGVGTLAPALLAGARN